MAISHTRSSKKAAPLTPRFVVLVALFAVVGFQASPSSSTSICALAAEAKYEGSTRGSSNGMLLQRTPGEEDVGEEVEHEFIEEDELQYEGSTRGFTNRMLLQRTQDGEEDDGVEDVFVAKAAAVCEDSRTIKIKPRKSKKKVFVCDYVKDNPEGRCKKTIKRVVKRKGKVVRTTKIHPRTHCCETCSSSDKPTPPPTEPAKVLCPDEEVPIAGQRCISDREELGFFMGQTCNYDWVGTGCTEAAYQCQPVTTCTCGNEYASTESEKNSWNCVHHDYEGVGLFMECPREPQPWHLSGLGCGPDAPKVGIRQ